MNKTKVLAIFVISIMSIFSIFNLFNFLLTNKSDQLLIPDEIDWLHIELGDYESGNISWIEIKEAKYSILDGNIYYLIKWNSSLPSPIKDLTNLTAPRYEYYYKVYISWTLDDGEKERNYTGFLLSDLKHFVHFELIEGEADFQLYPSIIPFTNDTVVAFVVTYLFGDVYIGNITQITILPSSTYISYQQFSPRISNLKEAPKVNGSINFDGNFSDWLENITNYKNLFPDRSVTPKEYFPIFKNLFVIRTDLGIIGKIELAVNFKKFLISQGSANVEIDWSAILAIDNGTYFADYAFSVTSHFSLNNSINTTKAEINMLGGEGLTATESLNWELPINNGYIGEGLEFYFPDYVIGNLFEKYWNIHFYSSLEIEFFSIIQSMH